MADAPPLAEWKVSVEDLRNMKSSLDNNQVRQRLSNNLKPIESYFYTGPGRWVWPGGLCNAHGMSLERNIIRDSQIFIPPQIAD